MNGVGDGFSSMDGDGLAVGCDAGLLPRVWGLLEGSLFLTIKIIETCVHANVGGSSQGEVNKS